MALPSEFYYGTSSKNDVGEWLMPSQKVYSRKRVEVTSSYDNAIFYANKAVEKQGGDPVVYVVEPDRKTLLQVRANDYKTAHAKIISIKNAEN